MASREQRDILAQIATFDPEEAQQLAEKLNEVSDGFEGLRRRVNGMLNPDDWGIRGATADAMLSSLEWVRNRLGDHADDTEAMGKSVQVIADVTIQARAAHKEISADTTSSDAAYVAQSGVVAVRGLANPDVDVTGQLDHAHQAHEARDSGYEERAGRMVDYVGEEVDRAIRMLPRSEKAAPRSYVTYMPPSSSGVDSSVTGLPSDGGASYAAALAEGRPAETDPDVDVSDTGSVVPSVGAVAAGVGVSGSLAWMFSWYAGERVEGMVGTPQGRMIRADSAEARYLYGPGGGDLMDRVREAGRLSFQDNNNPTGGAAGAAAGAAGAAAGAAGAAGLARGAASGVRWSNAQQMGMRPTRIPLSGQPQQGTGTGARGTGAGTRGTGVRGGQAQQAGMRGTGGARGGQAANGRGAGAGGVRGGQAQGDRGTGVRGGQAAGGRAGTGRGAGTGGVRGGQAQQSGRGTGRAGTGVRGGQAQQAGMRGTGMRGGQVQQSGTRGASVRGGQAQQSGVRGTGMRGAGRKRDERERTWSPEVWCAMRGREVPDPQEEERRKEEALKRLDAVWLSRHGAESVRERERREAEEATRREMFSRPLLYWREPREKGQGQ
ncbi:hypothetical protein [Actinobaculum sp. 352]|uniref:hypothetical protein n=2 Tax=Actinobaculum sp. 352 TaxID=2490946 RepID=UPI000F7F2B2E|nr:hypothetical protein [Actinobaculum sp. 352]RTE49453.1 hypothetical protein EKN07_05165 [Actinobaculum sp. 352]